MYPQWNETEITRRLDIRYPIIQGPFGGGLSTVRLASIVSNAGGLGSYGAHVLSPAEIGGIVSDIRHATSAPFAINLWVSDHDEGGLDVDERLFDQHVKQLQPIYDELGIPTPPFPPGKSWRFDEQIEAVLEARPPVFSFVFGIPSQKILAACRERGILTIGAATTLAEALALESAGVNAVLATGFEAGGHRPSFLKPAEESLVGTLALIPQIADRIRLPVIAAGGITNGRGIAAALKLGAEAVQLGTAFLACVESGIAPAHRELLFSERARDTILSRGFTGRLARFMRTRYLERFDRGEISPAPFPLQSWLTGFIKQEATQRNASEYMALYAGQAAPLIRHRHAKELMESLTGEVEMLRSGQSPASPRAEPPICSRGG